MFGAAFLPAAALAAAAAAALAAATVALPRDGGAAPAFVAARPHRAAPFLGAAGPAAAERPAAAAAGAARLLGAAAGAAAAAGALAGASRRRPAPAGRVRRAGWGDPVDFQGATVKENVQAADGLRLISIEAPSEVTAPFSKGGQFVQAKGAEDSKPSFYAISSPPGAEGPLEFLIKEAENNEWLTGAKSGDSVLLSPAMGKGYDLACEAWTSAGVSQVGIFATGSGVAPMRAVIESGALDGKVSRLYVGARTPGGLAYEDRFDAWRKRGVEVVPVLSKGGDDWAGRSGYVQDALKEDEERGEGFVLAAKHGAILCGQKEMVQGVREVYADLGVPEERTLLNF